MIKNNFDNEYHRIANDILSFGEPKLNKRTGKTCMTLTGLSAQYHLDNNYFPAITTKKLFLNSMIAELLGFIRGYDNAKDFRTLGCNFWDANANESTDWLNNINRKGKDDLGRIYGVQGRRWISKDGIEVDQLGLIIEKLNSRIDDRRLIMNYWNPGELDEMALPPCHDFYQFHLSNDNLDLTMYQRSNDIPLGTPVNIASCALLLILIAKITGLIPRKFTHFMGDAHVYEDQVDLLKTQLERTPYSPPKMVINPDIKTLKDLETWVTTEDFSLIGYEHHDHIRFPFSA